MWKRILESGYYRSAKTKEIVLAREFYCRNGNKKGNKRLHQQLIEWTLLIMPLLMMMREFMKIISP